MTMEMFRVIKGKIAFYRKEIESLRMRKEELMTELAQTGMNTELATSIMGLDEVKTQMYTSLIKEYENMILVLETIANVPPNDRLPRQS